MDPCPHLGQKQPLNLDVATGRNGRISVIQYPLQYAIERPPSPEVLQANAALAAPSTYPPLSAWNM